MLLNQDLSQLLRKGATLTSSRWPSDGRAWIIHSLATSHQQATSLVRVYLTKLVGLSSAPPHLPSLRIQSKRKIKASCTFRGKSNLVLKTHSPSRAPRAALVGSADLDETHAVLEGAHASRDHRAARRLVSCIACSQKKPKVETRLGQSKV